MERINKFLRAEYFAVGFLIIVMIVLFFVPPSMGVADNGDFERVMTSVGLNYAEDTKLNYFFDYSHPILKMEDILFWGNGSYIATHVIPIRIARVINRIFYSSEYFHMLSLALVYCVGLLLAIYLIVKNLKIKNKYFNGFIAVICVWVFGDAANIVYFNSLYGEAFSYISILLMLGFGLEMIRLGFQRKHVILFFIVAGLFFGSKLQYTLLSPLLFMMAIPIYRKNIAKKMVSVCLCLIIILSFLIYFVAPSQLGKDTKYNSVFYGVLKNSPTVKQDLKDLGLPEYMLPLAGTHAYQTVEGVDVKGEQFERDFYHKISRGKIILFYLTHFDRLIVKMQLIADMAYDNMIGMMGNYKIEDANVPHQQNTWFTSYNTLKKAAFPNNLWFLVLFYIAYFVYLFFSIIKTKCENSRSKYLLLLMILMIGVIQFPLPIIGNGEADIAKQLFVFNITFDIALFGAAYAIIKRIVIQNEK